MRSCQSSRSTVEPLDELLEELPVEVAVLDLREVVLSRGQARLGLLERELRGGGVERCDQLPLLDVLTDLDVNALQRPGGREVERVVDPGSTSPLPETVVWTTPFCRRHLSFEVRAELSSACRAV